jgi:ADP-ribosylglycohydrolase
MDSERVWRIVKETGRITGKVALGVVGAIAAIWVIGEAARESAEERENEARQKPPVIAEFRSKEDTFTAPFQTEGP